MARLRDLEGHRSGPDAEAPAALFESIGAGLSIVTVRMVVTEKIANSVRTAGVKVASFGDRTSAQASLVFSQDDVVRVRG